MSIAGINSPKEHAYIDPRAPQLPEPTYAERVRTMVFLSSIATLSTVCVSAPDIRSVLSCPTLLTGSDSRSC